MKVISINMHGYQEEETISNFKKLSEYIKKENIDTIILQEVAEINGDKESNTSRILQSYLKEYYLYCDMFKACGKKHSEGLAVLSKFELFDCNAYRISHTNDFSSWEKRVALLAKVKYNGKDVLLATTHMGWTSETESYEQQSLKFNKIIEESGCEHIIIGGDFNATYDSEEFQTIRKLELDSIFINDTRPTFIGDHEHYTDKPRNIDHILTRGFRVNDKKFTFDEEPISDHVGLYTDIEILL